MDDPTAPTPNAPAGELTAEELDSRTAYAVSTLRAVIRDSGEAEWPEWFHAPWLTEDLCPLLDSLRAALLAARREVEALRQEIPTLRGAMELVRHGLTLETYTAEQRIEHTTRLLAKSLADSRERTYFIASAATPEEK